MNSHGIWPVAIIGSGNIGTDLLIKIQRGAGPLRVVAMVGMDPNSDGLASAAGCGVRVTADGVDGLLAMPEFNSIRLVFDATSTETHHQNWAKLEPAGVRMIDLTPSAIGPSCVPAVNLEEHLDAPNINMVTCGGQATIPIVAAVAQTGVVSYAEIVSSISSRSAGPETRANLDEFIETTVAALQSVGGAHRGKAVIVLNPADPPVLMRNTVYCLVEGAPDRRAIEQSVHEMVNRVGAYVPGYRLKQRIQFETFSRANPLHVPEMGAFEGTRMTVLLEVIGAADHLPAYAGNLDIITSAAKAAAERIVLRAREDAIAS